MQFLYSHNNYCACLYKKEGRTGLLVACCKEYYEIAHQLLVAGASPNAQDQVM